jgi:hypothetical protein
VSLRTTVRKAAVTAFKAIGDIARPVTYKALTGVLVRDLEAGTSVPQVVNHTITMTVFTKFSEKEVDENVSVLTDEKLLFPSLLLPVQAKSADLILDEHGRTWEIIRRLSDPADAVVMLHVRTSR